MDTTSPSSRSLRRRPICCPHAAGQHAMVRICDVEVRFASEELPCECHDTDPTLTLPPVCPGCNHAAGTHRIVKVCRPGTEICGCTEPIA